MSKGAVNTRAARTFKYSSCSASAILYVRATRNVVEISADGEYPAFHSANKCEYAQSMSASKHALSMMRTVLG